MIHKHTIGYSAHQPHSPLSFIDTNIPQRVKQTQILLKSPQTQNQNRLRRVVTYRSPSSALSQSMQSSCKQNFEPRKGSAIGAPTMGNYTIFKEAPIKFSKVNALTVSNLKTLKQPAANFTIMPFSLDTTPGIPQMSMVEKDFIKIKELGKGKFGTVWLARHKKTNFVCALKIILKSVVRQQKVDHQVAKQLRIHNKLKHLNIISFYGFFTDQQNFYIVTEFATQGHVYGKLRKQHRLEEFQVKDLTKQTTDGLRFIHNMGYIHRDIKPQNLLLQFGIVKICDFGWAAQCMENQLRKSQCGTPLYYSPEIVRKDPHNTQIDIWSLGLLAYQLLVGRVPFKIWSQFDLPVILQQEVSVPEYVDATQDLKDFIYKCLIKDQKQRPNLKDLRNHIFICQGLPLVQCIAELYAEVKSLF